MKNFTKQSASQTQKCQHYANPNTPEVILEHCDMCPDYERCYPNGAKIIAKQSEGKKQSSLLKTLTQLFY